MADLKPWKPTKQQLIDAAGKTLPDVIAPNLRVLFCGINPGLYTAAVGHHFARPGIDSGRLFTSRVSLRDCYRHLMSVNCWSPASASAMLSRMQQQPPPNLARRILRAVEKRWRGRSSDMNRESSRFSASAHIDLLSIDPRP